MFGISWAMLRQSILQDAGRGCPERRASQPVCIEQAAEVSTAGVLLLPSTEGSASGRVSHAPPAAQDIGTAHHLVTTFQAPGVSKDSAHVYSHHRVPQNLSPSPSLPS